MSTCPTCEGSGRIPFGECGVDCAAMHNGGHVPDAPGWEQCDACRGTGLGIEVSYQCMGMWVAVFDDYDGAEDAHDHIGHGKSKQAAVDDLIEQATESGRIGREAGHQMAVREVRS